MAANPALQAQRQMVEALTDPVRYPHPVTTVHVIETHISFVLLTGRYAYKIKKAVDLGFLDYTSLEKRRLFCVEELRLNRRLAEPLYLDVVTIAGSPADPRFDSHTEVLEYAVRMREFPQKDRLDHRLASHELSEVHIDQLALYLARFHQSLPRAAPDSSFATPALIRDCVVANFSELNALPDISPQQVRELQGWSLAEIERLSEVFQQRLTAGQIRECHGDVHLGNIVLWEGTPLVFDCIEFNDELRWIDVFNDLAFLTMDLAAHACPDYAWRLLNDWLEVTGDFSGLDTLRFYEVYRALVRAKIAALRLADKTTVVAEQTLARTDLAAYLGYASSRIRPENPFLIIMHGFSGSGKSTVARYIAPRLGAICLRSDVERKRLHGLPSHADSHSKLGDGLYTPAATVSTYERLEKLATVILDAGLPLIVDAAFLRRWQRQVFYELGRRRDIPFLMVDCQAPGPVLSERLASRTRLELDASEATPAVLVRQLSGFDPLDGAEKDVTLTIDTSIESSAGLAERILERLRILRCSAG